MSTPEKEIDVVFEAPKGKLAISKESRYTKIRCNVCWKEGCFNMKVLQMDQYEE